MWFLQSLQKDQPKEYNQTDPLFFLKIIKINTREKKNSNCNFKWEKSQLIFYFFYSKPNKKTYYEWITMTVQMKIIISHTLTVMTIFEYRSAHTKSIHIEIASYFS